MTKQNLIKSFFRTGICGFGGGSALIPIIEEEAVQRRHFLSETEYGNAVMAACVTPGALPVKLAAGCGSCVSGNRGFLLAAYSFTLPSLLLLGGMLFLLSTIGASLLPQLRWASIGIAIFICYLLLEYIARVLRQARREGDWKTAGINFILAAVLTGGKDAAQLLSLFIGRPISIYAISVTSMICLFLLLFFLLDGSYSSWRLAPAGLLTLAYLAGDYFSIPLLGWGAGLLAVIAIAALFRKHRIQGSAELRWKGSQKGVFKRLAIVWLLPLIAAVPAMYLGGISQTVRFILAGTKSAMLSFGGGEAYLAIADDMFVGTYITTGQLYESLLPLANLLPGPILVKLLTGVGFYQGGALAGDIGAIAWMLLGAAVGVSASLTLFVPLLNLCEANRTLPLFTRLQTWLLPVICGMMVTVLLSLVCSALTTMGDCATRQASVAILLLLLFSIAFLKRLHVPDVVLVLLSGAASLLLFMGS